MCAVLARQPEHQGGRSVPGVLHLREGSYWLQSASSGDHSCGWGNLQTPASLLSVYVLLLLL